MRWGVVKNIAVGDCALGCRLKAFDDVDLRAKLGSDFARDA